MTDPHRRHQFRLWQLALDRFELQLRVTAARTRNRYIREAATAYTDNGVVPGWLDERNRRAIQVQLQEHYRKVIPYFGALSLKQVKSRRFEQKAATDLFTSLISEWISTQALRKAWLIASTDHQDVLDAIADGVTEGLGTADIARRIRKVTALTPYRAATVARTETNTAATYGSIQSVRAAEQDLGVRMLKEWLPTLDDRTREEHRAMAGSQPIPLDEKFTVGGDLMDRPCDPNAGPENTINCRCALVYEEAE